MSATRWLAGLCALVPLQGCVTDKLWNDWGQPPELHNASICTRSSRAAPQEVLKAVRAGDGSHHLVVRMTDGLDHYYVIDGPGRAPEGEAATIGSHQWPGTTTESASLPEPRQVAPGAPTIGLPLGVVNPRAPWWMAHETPDPAMAILVDAPADATPDDPVVSLDDRKVVLTDEDGLVTVLAEFSPPPPLPRVAPAPRPAPRSRPVARVAETGARLVLTPFALVTDVAIGAVAVVGGALVLPFLLPFVFAFGWR